MNPNPGGGGVSCGSQPMSIDVHKSPNELWRSNTIFNLWLTSSGHGYQLDSYLSISTYPHPKKNSLHFVSGGTSSCMTRDLSLIPCPSTICDRGVCGTDWNGLSHVRASRGRRIFVTVQSVILKKKLRMLKNDLKSFLLWQDCIKRDIFSVFNKENTNLIF